MSRGAVWRADAAHILALAGPLVLTQLAQVALGTTSVVMLGRLEALDLAAGGLALSVFNLLRTMGVGLITPAGNLVAAASAGGGDVGAKVRELSRAVFALATAAGLACWALMALATRPLLALAGQEAELVERCVRYLAFAAPGIVPLLWFQVLRNLTVGLRRPGPLLAITLASVGLNIALNLWLMDVPGLSPLAGIALAGTLVQAFAFAALLALVRRDAALRPLVSLRFWRAGGPALRQLVRQGGPVAATYGSEAGFFSALALLVGLLGADALAAHTVVNQAVYVVFMVAVGLSHGVSISISPAWARGDAARARRLGWAGLGLGWIAMGGVAAVYLLAPHAVLAAFIGPQQSPGVLSLALLLLPVAALLQVFDCSQNIAIGMLRGLGDTGSAFWRTLVGYWLVGLPAAWWLALPAGWGLRGVWAGLILGLAATAAQLLLRFHRRIAEAGRDAAAALPGTAAVGGTEVAP